MADSTLEKIFQGLQSVLTAALQAAFTTESVCTRDIGEDDQKIPPSATPRAYLWRQGNKAEDDTGQMVRRCAFTVTILARCPKDDTSGLQPLLNNAETCIEKALVGPPGAPIGFVFDSTIKASVILVSTDPPDYGRADAYMDQKFELLYTVQE